MHEIINKFLLINKARMRAYKAPSAPKKGHNSDEAPKSRRWAVVEQKKAIKEGFPRRGAKRKKFALLFMGQFWGKSPKIFYL